VNGSSEETVVFDRYNSLDPATAQELKDLDNQLIEATPEEAPAVQSALYDLLNGVGTAQGIQFTPVYGAVTGKLIGEISDTIHLWYGSEEQPVDSAEAAWYEDGVSADRGITKIVFVGYGPLEIGAQLKVILRNNLNEKKSIIKERLGRAGWPATRVNLRSIPDSKDIGWWVDGKEPARVLCELVASKAIHDLACMSTADGFCLTDISRSNPTYISLTEGELGAYSNDGGRGQATSSGSISMETAAATPRDFKINYRDYSLDFADTYAKSTWPDATGKSQEVTAPLVSKLQGVQDWCDVTHCELMAARGTHNLVLMPHRAEVASGCVLIVPDKSGSSPNGVEYLRVLKAPRRDDGCMECQCVPYDPAVYGRHKSVEQVVANYATVIDYQLPEIVIADGVALTDYMAGQATVIMAASLDRIKPYGGVVVRSNPAGYFDDIRLPIRGSVGETVTSYTYGDDDMYGFDYDTTLRVTLYSGELVSADSEDDVTTKHCNVLWWGGTYLAFVAATPVAPTGGIPAGTYDITGIMPGLRGSDYVRTIASGATVVKITDEFGVFDPGLYFAPIPISRVRVPLQYRMIMIADNSKTSDYVDFEVTGNTLVPIAPSSGILKGSDGAGGYVVKVIGGTRYAESYDAFWANGTNIRQSDPLQFTMELLDGSDVVATKTVTPSTPEADFVWTAAELTTAFGSVPGTLTGNVWQAGTFFDGRKRSFTAI
jgi:hypothetical protein